MKRLLTLILFLFAIASGSAQNSNNKLNLVEGTRYMVAFPQVWASPSEKPLPQPMQLFVSSKVKTKIRVQTPSGINDAARIDREYSLEPNKVLKISISTTYMNVNSQTRAGYGILVTSKAPISVSTYQAWMGNGELARHIPINAWGKNYFTANFYQDRYGTEGSGYKYRPSQILLISDKDNTVVSYTPTVATEGGSELPDGKKGQTQTVTLEKGETFLIKAKIDENYNKQWETDLSGTVIRSNKPVGVVSGHTKVAVMRYPDVLPPTGMFAAEAHFVRNNVHDAQLPIEMSGTKFVTAPCLYTPTRVVGQASAEFGIDDDRGDVIRFIALEDNTKIFSMRQDGSGMKAERSLRKGESFIATAVDVVTYWESDKPVLATHYGKSYAKILPPAFIRVGNKENDGTQGHPTVESGMPMMQYVPSVDRWTNYGVFNSPEGMDNFFNIVFKASEIGKIKVDGRSLTSAFGGAMRLIKGTPYAVVRTPIGAGDHFVESTELTVRWVAWNYGSLDGLQQGRAYGTPVSIDLSVPCDDSLDIQYQIVCGDVEGNVKLLPENSTCAQFFAFVVEDENNFTLEADVDNLSDYKVFPFKLKVSDKKKPAFARIRIVTRSGNWIEKEFKYDGIDLSFNPASINFGIKPISETACTTVVVTNMQKTPVSITNLKFKNTRFTVSPSALQLGPNESKNIEVCGTVLTEVRQVDTLIAEINCVELKYLAVEIKGDEPLFYAGDQNWGTLPKNDKQTKQVELVNAGKSDIIITEYQPRGDVYFTNSTLIKSIPLTLKPGQRFKYDVDYSPNGEVGIAHTLRITYTTNATKEKLYSDLSGTGTDAELSVSSFSWLERVLDQYQAKKGINKYQGSVKVQNLGNAPSYIKSISIEGPDSVYFSWEPNPALNSGMAPGEYKSIDVVFTPNEVSMRQAERTYTAQLVVTYEVNGQVKQAKSTLDGTAIQPMVTLSNQDWGSQTANSVTTLPITIANINIASVAPLNKNEGGTMDLLVDSLVIVGSEPFVWSNTGTKKITFNPPVRVASLATEFMFVDFMPTKPGIYSTTYRLYGNTLDTAVANLRGESPGESKVEPLHMLTWIGTSVTGNVTGAVAYPTTLTFKEFRGNDYISFNPAPGANLLPFNVDANSSFSFGVEFTPDKVTKAGLKQGQNLNGRLPFRDDKYITTIVFEDANGNELLGEVSGDAKYLETTLRIIAQKDLEVNSTANVAFFLEPTPEAIDSGAVESARLRVKFDNQIVYPLPIDYTKFPTALLIQEVGSPSMVEIDLVTSLQVSGYLGAKQFQTLLNANTKSPITGEYYMINKGDKVASPYVVVNVIPDEIIVIPVCASTKRLISFGSKYSITVKNNLIDVSVGINGNLSLTSVNELGQSTVIFDGNVSAGTHTFQLKNEGIQWIVAKQGDWLEVIPVIVSR
jgi:hypothetical protein